MSLEEIVAVSAFVTFMLVAIRSVTITMRLQDEIEDLRSEKDNQTSADH